jgi:outer membrane protein OmpA-like peptidoglycan-associated protein
MSDEHGHNDGAHEIDKMPSGRLFSIVTILSVLTLALIFGVIQLFNQQVRSIEGERIAKGYASQNEYESEMAAVADGFGKYEIVKKGGEGKPDKVTTRYFVPVEKATKQVLDNPALLAGKRPSKDWAGTGTGKKVAEWGGMPKPTPARPGAKKVDPKAAAANKGPRDHRFSFAVIGEDLALLGEVPSDAVSKAIEAAAKKTHFGDKVRNKLKVTNSPGKPGFDAAYKRALASLDLMSTGAAKWTAGKLSLSGYLPDANKAKFEALSQGAGGPPMGKVDVSSTEAADSCDAQFAKALKKGVAFKGDTAELDAKADKVIGRLAEIAKTCPGKFVIEGHAASQAAPDANKQLSLARANAVSAAMQEKGIEKAQLRAKGYGQDREKADRVGVHIAR